MKLTSIHITDFRSIGNVELDCAPGFNVIAGVNGAGKSSFLDALEILLSWLSARLRTENGKGQLPSFDDIKKGAPYSYLWCTADSFEGSWGTGRVARLYRKGDAPKSDLVALTAYADKLIESFAESEGTFNMPMVVKYSVNRSLIDIPTRVRKKHTLDAMSLYREKSEAGANLRSFFEWFREREDIEREMHEENRSFSHEDPQLKWVRRAISKCMEGYGELHTRRKAPAGFELKKNGETFRVAELSDGEKCYMTLIGDIARRLAICNPALDNPLEGEGIVLIDELELHLHPQWQAQSIQKLREIFPNCQFFITTHSAHIVQSLLIGKTDSLTLLKEGKKIEVDALYGSPVDSVLFEVFGMQSLRPKELADLFNDTWAILDDGEYEGERINKKMNELKGILPAGDKDLMRLNMQINLNKVNHAKD